MAKDEGDDLLPDKDAAKGFYAKYEPKEILGRFVYIYNIFIFFINYFFINSYARILIN